MFPGTEQCESRSAGQYSTTKKNLQVPLKVLFLTPFNPNSFFCLKKGEITACAFTSLKLVDICPRFKCSLRPSGSNVFEGSLRGQELHNSESLAVMDVVCKGELVNSNAKTNLLPLAMGGKCKEDCKAGQSK